MREIEFRGKRKDTGEWVYGSVVPTNGAPFIVQMNHLGELLPRDCHEVIPETVGQLTGLKDKNGVKIYEGDTMSYPDTRYGSSGVCIVKYIVRYGKFIGDERGNVQDISMGWLSSYAEVIDNIHDTPELLGGAE